MLCSVYAYTNHVASVYSFISYECGVAMLEIIW